MTPHLPYEALVARARVRDEHTGHPAFPSFGDDSPVAPVLYDLRVAWEASDDQRLLVVAHALLELARDTR